MKLFHLPNAVQRLARRAQVARVLAEGTLQASLVRRRGRVSLGRHLEQLAKHSPHRSALLFEERHYSYGSLNSAANRVSSTLTSMGAQPRDCVCVLMDNRPELLFTLIGANKLGVVTMLPCPDLNDDELVSAVTLAAPRWIVVGESELTRVARVLSKLPLDPHNVLVWSDAPLASLPGGVSEMNRLVGTASDANPRTTGRQAGDDLCAYLPESCDRGARRMAKLSNQRLLRVGAMMGNALLHLDDDDVTYIALPLQSTEGLSSFAASLAVGATVALRRRFDADGFWRDCARYGASVIPFDPATCATLLSAPSHPRERSHRVRLAMGRGLSSGSLRSFQDRFGIERIVQHYEAQAGNVFLFNATGEPGVLGVLTAGLHVAKLREPEGTPMLDHRGRIVPCRAGELGTLIARIDGMRSYDGYVDLDHTKARSLSDPVGDGANYFDTGLRVVVHEGGAVSLPA